MKIKFMLDPKHRTADGFAVEIKRAHAIEVEVADSDSGQSCIVTYEDSELGRRLAQNDMVIYSGTQGVQAEVAE